MTTPSRPNFFLLLQLNPDEPWDQELYQKALDGKVRQWSHDSLGIAKKALPAQVYRGLLPKIRQVMEDPRLREQEAKGARALLATRYQKEYQKFERQLFLLNLKEAVDQEEIDCFTEEFKHIVSARVIERRITTKVRPPRTDDEHVKQVLDASMAKNIEDHLAVVHAQTLYELLHATRNQATTSLLQAAERLYAYEVRQRPTAEMTALVELAGFAMAIFRSDEMRTRYDETLRQSSIQQLLQELTESVRRSSTKEIHPAQVLYFLRNAEEMGWRREEALEKLKEHGRIHQWFIIMPAMDQQINASEHTRIGEIISPLQDVDTQYRSGLVTHRAIWRRTRAVLLVVLQLACLLILVRGEFGIVRPTVRWNELGELGHWLQPIAVVRVVEAQVISPTINAVVHTCITLVLLLTSCVLDLFLCVFLLTCAIPLLFAGVGLLFGSGSALKSLGKTLLTMRSDGWQWMIAAERGQKRRKTSALAYGWFMERLMAENLALVLHKAGQRWFDFADVLTEWKWMRNWFVVYWVYPVRFGCQLAGLTHSIASIEMDALCTSIYTVILLIVEMTVFVGNIVLFVVRRLVRQR